MKYVIIILFLSSLNAPKEPSSCLEMDIILIGDYSGSVIGHEKFIADAFSSFVSQFELSEETMKIGLITFNSKAKLISPITSSKSTLETHINELYTIPAMSTTNMSDALYMALNEFNSSGRPGFRKLIILVSDGAPDTPTQTKQIADQLKLSNVSICGVLIQNGEANDDYMKNISSNFCYVQSNFANLTNELKKLDICI